MSRIKGKDTKPEIILRKKLWDNNLRYRLKNKLPGRPDIVFPGCMVAIFVDGCFWHKCPQHFIMPKTRMEFWREKINKNVDRDLKVNEMLSSKGWRVIRIWEHEVMGGSDKILRKISKYVHK